MSPRSYPSLSLTLSLSLSLSFEVDVLAPALEDVSLYAGSTAIARYAFSRQRDSVVHAMRSVGALVTVSVYEPSTPPITATESGETSGLQV